MVSIEVIGLGAMNLDHVYQVERILTDGEARVKDCQMVAGGSAANTIFGLAKLGVRTSFIGAVGNDQEGTVLMDDLNGVGVDTSQIKVKKKVETGSVLCFSDELGRRTLYVSPGANNLLSLRDINIDYINQARILHITSFVDDKQFNMTLNIMGKLSSSVQISFAPGMLYAAKGIKKLAPILERAQFLFINKQEMKQLTGKDFLLGVQECHKLGCRIVVVTLGKGLELGYVSEDASIKKLVAACYISNKENRYMIKPKEITDLAKLDTIGAGDTFTAGFLFGYIRGKPLDECGYLGDITARFSMTKLGARAGLPTLAELSQTYQKLYGST